jgi:hypothetical protein
MEKKPRPVSHTHAKKGHQQSGRTPAEQPIPGSHSHLVPEERGASPQREAAFASLPDVALACDQDGKLLCMNAASLKLFEVSSARPWLGISSQEFLQRYEWCDEQQRPAFLAPWRLHPASDAEAASFASETDRDARPPFRTQGST